RSYQLNPDATPPTLTVVAPKDGEFVPRGETVEVIFKVFDRFGVDRVEVCRDSEATPDVFADLGACQALADPTRYLLNVAADASQPIVLHARAMDLNGLYSVVQQITLNPFDAEDVAPALAFT